MAKHRGQKRVKLTAPFTIILRKHKAKRQVFLADPRKLKEPATTAKLDEAYQYTNRNSGDKFLRTHRALKRKFRCTRARV